MITSYLALGSNLGNPVDNLIEACKHIQNSTQIKIKRQAPIYRSKPVGPQEQPDFYNSAIEVDTTLSPHELLALAKHIEELMGRKKTIRWGPRCIDIDIALYGQQIVSCEDLIVPHKELPHRAFVLQPLSDLVPAFKVPNTQNTIKKMLTAVEHQLLDLEKIPSPSGWPLY